MGNLMHLTLPGAVLGTRYGGGETLWRDGRGYTGAMFWVCICPSRFCADLCHLVVKSVLRLAALKSDLYKICEKWGNRQVTGGLLKRGAV